MNPVLVREWKSFFRGNSPYYFLIFYAVVHLLIFLGASVPVLQGGAIYDGALKNTGRILAGRLFGVQLLLIILSFPSLSVKLMTWEKEDEAQQLTRIIPCGNWKIICWKLTASIIIWVLLIVTILPLFLFSFSIGGVTLKELALLIGIIIASVLCCGGIGFLYAVIIDQPGYSLAATYFSVFAVACLLGYLNYPDSIIMRFLYFSF